MALSTFKLQTGEVHLWHVCLAQYITDSARFREILTPDEILRADRFHFAIHNQRFTITRAILRYILSYYLMAKPQDLQLNYSKKGKPFVANTQLNFNVSHSHDYAVFGFTQTNAIGVDIEQINSTYNDEVAMRYFSQAEIQEFNALPKADKANGFFTLWARKEAVIKAIGDGLSYALPSFSVSLQHSAESLDICDKRWYLENFFVDPGYASAFVTDYEVAKIQQFEWAPALTVSG